MEYWNGTQKIVPKAHCGGSGEQPKNTQECTVLGLSFNSDLDCFYTLVYLRVRKNRLPVKVSGILKLCVYDVIS